LLERDAIEMTDANQYHKEIVRRLYEECANHGDMAPLDAWVAPDFTANNGSKGPAGMADTLNELRTAFPDICFTIERLIAEGDYVAVRWKWVGTQRETFRQYAASGKRVTNTGHAIYQFSDRRIVCMWLENDRLGVLQQIGAIAPVATASVPEAHAAERR
jgi:predicted ester cyclase